MRRFLCLLLLVLAGLGAQAATPMLRDLAVLPDKSGTLTIDAVAATDPAQFKPLPAGSFAGGFTRSAHWFRFTIAQAGETWLDILPPVLDDLRLYEPDPAVPGGWRERRSGDTLPFAAREVAYRGFIFKLQHADATPRTYYLRLSTTSTSALLPRLWQPDAFIAAATLESSLLIASIAIIATVLLLNLNAWIWLRDPLTPWFMMFLLLLALFFLGTTGFLQQYLFPDLPAASYYIVSSLSFLLIAVGNGFYRRLFGIQRSNRVLFGLYAFGIWLPLFSLPAALLGYFTEIAPLLNSMTMLLTLLGLVLSSRLWHRGAPGAAMMFVANLISLVGILFFVLNVLGAITGGFMLWHSLQIASLGSILALQLAVGARYRSLRDAQLQAERDALHEREIRIRQGQFLAMLAHELRTALSVLKMAVGSQPMPPKAIASAERAMAGMNEVIDRSIQAEKLADGALLIDNTPCDVAGLLEAVIADSGNPGRIRAVISQRPIRQTDAKLLRIILANLVDNALKYGPPDALVDISLTDSDALLIRVSNPVVPAGRPDPARVFDKYYRAPQAHGLTGSGLGLHIASAMATLLGGTLRYQPMPDRITFELHL
jgi:two-component system, sensor histidine kinase LadS